MTVRILCSITMLIVTLIISTLVKASVSEPLLIMDARNLGGLPKHFRTSSSLLPSNINIEGLSHLRIAGGAQFSKLALVKILEQFHHHPIVIIDLREESHGFLNGNAISWFVARNAINTQKSVLQIENDQARLFEELAQQVNAMVYTIVNKTPDGKIGKIKGTEFLVHHVMSEADLLQATPHRYYRIYVQDFHAPNDQQVDRFIQITKKLPENQWIYFHCRAGLGRTTTFMAMYDMLRNGKKVSFDAILARQAALGGKNLRELPSPTHFKYQSAKSRLLFLKKFYQYANQNDDDYHTSWTTWKKSHLLSNED